jgi:hypothetical protein
MFSWGRSGATKKRADQIARMLAHIKHGMRTKTYKAYYDPRQGDYGRINYSIIPARRRTPSGV